jgi:hypothetical protein
MTESIRISDDHSQRVISEINEGLSFNNNIGETEMNEYLARN